MLTSILQTIGNTPMLRLDLSRDLPGTVWLKLENRNPGGSIKDRVAFHLVGEALEEGRVEPGGVLVEATSGNMGIGMALVASVRGFRCILTMPESMSVERRNLLRALGAELVLTPAEQGMSGAVAAAKRIAEEQDAFVLGQFTNPQAVVAHYKTTGPEIFKDSVGKMDVLVAGVGSGSTITGVGRYLKERIPGFRVVAVEPAASPVLSGGKPGPHLIQGIGADFVPAILDRALLDEIIQMDGEEAIRTARLLMENGIMAGISTGSNVRAALDLAARPEMQDKNIVTFVCDTGERYMSTRLFQGI
ncbi:cysteine synthase A [Desulfovibrio desulfuricans]|uniref:Cysteine synthase n=1 Tax=uncultured Desulfovibrio sp. TaxID=167968 RepID=A0A212JSU2_9BACT|nr:cysteine synthase A [Desulfovibrio desulfuricans]MBT9748828.1 cysteine synthase A [Desulfovibrio desulfuricans]MCB6541402.1 cysteine synthase A [Desulfovibrio desulfuricans]MCB6552484.1 cysteine synthase A [Desulfovibrio desulfuricans]MCB6564268.1 cysteine synthase A [Desulfovibrio desulfuricans]MCB7345508.1 cysteine synthase A [Desulfovibrio desulfuricans]